VNHREKWFLGKTDFCRFWSLSEKILLNRNSALYSETFSEISLPLPVSSKRYSAKTDILHTSAFAKRSRFSKMVDLRREQFLRLM